MNRPALLDRIPCDPRAEQVAARRDEVEVRAPCSWDAVGQVLRDAYGHESSPVFARQLKALDEID